jgi:hypothetical protein
VRAAGVGSDRGAREGQHGGEDDLPGSDARKRGGAGREARDHVVREQQRPGFLPGELGRPGAQGAARTADGLLQVKERDFSQPPLMPVKNKWSLAFRRIPGRY